MAYLYVPTLRWKKGERDAIRALSAGARGNVQPIFCLAPDQFVGKKATKAMPAIAAPTAFAASVAASWGLAPFALDASELSAGSAGHPLIAIAAAARASGIKLIPARRLLSTSAYEAAVSAVASVDQRGVVLRATMAEVASAATWLSTWPFPLAETDLVIDLGSDVGTIAAMGAAIDPVFQGLHSASAWRSISLVGCSMPENFTGVASGVFALPRIELNLWQRLISIGLPYQLNFGDYATISTAPPPSGIKWGYPIGVKYTLPADFLICRGVRTTGKGAQDMDVQLRQHATSIVAYTPRHRLSHCWGDDRIDQIAAGTTSPGSLATWVAISVNRHLERTRQDLP